MRKPIGIALVSILLAMLLTTAPAAADSRAIYARADVSITSTGVPDQVKLVVPPLSPDMAAPIENVIGQWTFAPATEAGLAVPRTTSVSVVIKLVAEPSGASRIEVEKLEEGPRIVRASLDRCLEDMAEAGRALTFTVTEEGRAVEISGLNSEDESEQCAIQVMRNTIFKPETVNGRKVSSRVTRQVRFNARRLILSSTPAMGQADAKWHVDGKEVPATEWRSADGPFRAMLFFTDEPQALYRAWNSGARPQVNGVESIRPGQQFEAIVIFVDCEPNDQRQCRVTSDWKIATSDGRNLGEASRVPTWVDKRAGRPQELMIAERGVGMSAELGFGGSYIFTVLVRDEISGRQVELRRQITVATEAE